MLIVDRHFRCRELKEAPYGIELMQCVGSVYILRAKQHLASAKSLFGAGGWVLNAQGQYQTLGKGWVLVDFFQSFTKYRLEQVDNCRNCDCSARSFCKADESQKG